MERCDVQPWKLFLIYIYRSQGLTLSPGDRVEREVGADGYTTVNWDSDLAGLFGLGWAGL